MNGLKSEKASQELRDKITSAPVKTFPDFNKPFTLYTEASSIAVGAVPIQIGDDKNTQ